MKRIGIGRIFVVILTAFLLGACSKVSAIEMGDDAKDISLVDIDGKPVSLAEFRGKVIILDFFASWCPPCREEIPDFIKLQNEYKDKGFSVVGVSLVDPKESKDFARQIGINYPIVVDDGRASSAYGPVRGIPTTFVIDKNFKIARVYIGYRPKEVFENDIKELLR